MGSKPRIAIVGAGIGGLSLGLALRERGLQANVFEQASELTEIGAAIAMSANSTREFMRLGLVDQIAAASTIPTELIYRRWRTKNRIAAHPVAKDDWYVRRFGAPYFGIHRADLQRSSVVRSAWRTCTSAAGWSTSSTRPTRWCWSSPTGGSSTPTSSSVPMGCALPSGAGSPGPTTPSIPGPAPSRGIVPVENLPSLPDPHAIQFWMGPDAHLLHYAIGLAWVPQLFVRRKCLDRWGELGKRVSAW